MSNRSLLRQLLAVSLYSQSKCQHKTRTLTLLVKLSGACPKREVCEHIFKCHESRTELEIFLLYFSWTVLVQYLRFQDSLSKLFKFLKFCFKRKRNAMKCVRESQFEVMCRNLINWFIFKQLQTLQYSNYFQRSLIK